ncbi:MAG: hypothetical protein JWM95_4784 [Gemmatimonadetes bacterium]|nr:hypothetical protein [Gemmatimonadota bacterium]
MRAHALFLLLFCSITAGAQDATVTLGGRTVSLWLPASREPAPVVIYSHGFGGCPSQPAYLLEALAAHGYVVVSPRHRDAACGRRTARPGVPFSAPARWTDETYANRRDDIRAVERALHSNVRFRHRIDFTRLAYAGHSLGGYTAIALAGGWASWSGAPAPRAVLALCPYVKPFMLHNTLRNVRAPIMFQGGTLDVGITSALEREGGAYDSMRDAKYLVVFRNAGHLTWGGRANDTHDDIVAYSIAFLDRYVKGLPATATLTDAGELAQFRYDSELGRRTGIGH